MRDELRAESVELVRRGQIAVPEQPGRLFERRVRGELADGIAGDEQLAALTVDMTETRRRRDDAVETGKWSWSNHGDQARPMYIITSTLIERSIYEHRRSLA